MSVMIPQGTNATAHGWQSTKLASIIYCQSVYDKNTKLFLNFKPIFIKMSLKRFYLPADDMTMSKSLLFQLL